ncbi:hypothetical protein A2U01_0085707, partial [Trifolium medium]|nr:hypothetical protein [Trifolium medium]
MLQNTPNFVTVSPADEFSIYTFHKVRSTAPRATSAAPDAANSNNQPLITAYCAGRRPSCA